MNSAQKAYSKLKWTPQEEQLLKSLKEQKHIDSWKIIANQMNEIFLQKNRSGKQCRERYMNYVRFGKETPKMLGWTPTEDEQLFVKFMEHGAKWVQIGKQMPGRSQNCLKNRFYGAMRKIIRKINRVVKQKKMRQKKPIKTELLIRILESPINKKKQNKNNQADSIQFLQHLKKQMIKIAINPEQNSSTQQIESLINGISKFSSMAKLMNQKRTLNKQSQYNESNISGQVIQSHEFGQDKSEDGKQGQENKQQEIQNLESKLKTEAKHKILPTLILFSSQSDKIDRNNQDHKNYGNGVFRYYQSTFSVQVNRI